MNWVVKFNQLERENTDKVLDIVAKFDKYKIETLDDVYTKAYALKYSIGSLLDKLYAHAIVGEPLKEEVERLIKLYIEMKEDYENARKQIQEYTVICGTEAAELKSSMLDTVLSHITRKKDINILRARMAVFTVKLINMSYVFDMGYMGEFEVLKENYQDLMTIKKIIDERNQQYDEEQYELMQKLKESQKKDYLKIFNYKEMIELAEREGYRKVRQSGDHIIMQHNNTNKVIPIPAHELKYGLMIQIQKQIEANKAS